MYFGRYKVLQPKSPIENILLAKSVRRLQDSWMEDHHPHSRKIVNITIVNVRIILSCIEEKVEKKEDKPKIVVKKTKRKKTLLRHEKVAR